MIEDFLADPDLNLTLVRPASKDKTPSRALPNWLRQRVETIIWTLKGQLGLEHPGAGARRAYGPASSTPPRPQRRHLTQLAEAPRSSAR